MRDWRISAMNVITAVAAAYILSGCATVAVDGTRHQQAVKPDFVLVRDFAVRPADVHLDQGVATTVELESGMLDQTDEEIRIGRAASEALAQKLVTALREAGIPAHRERDGMRPTQRTAIVAGRFVTIDEGNRTARVTLGFGLGKTEVRTRVAVYQNNQLLADADTATGSAPRTGLTAPSRLNSPRTRKSSRRRASIWPLAARSPRAIGRSNAAPSFFTSAGARWAGSTQPRRPGSGAAESRASEAGLPRRPSPAAARSSTCCT